MPLLYVWHMYLGVHMYVSMYGMSPSVQVFLKADFISTHTIIIYKYILVYSHADMFITLNCDYTFFQRKVCNVQ